VKIALSLPYGSLKPPCCVTGQRLIATSTPASDLRLSVLSAIEVSFVGLDCSALKIYQMCCDSKELFEVQITKYLK